MMKVLWCAVAATFVTGCVCTKQCDRNEDCDEGGACSAYGFCVTAADAGAVDGGQTETDSGMNGDAGPSDSGTVVDAGALPETTCTVTCQAWETCEATFDGGVCSAVSLTFETPREGDVFDAGETVAVTVGARRADGGVISSLVVPLRSDFVVETTVASGNPAQIALPAALGHFTFSAGWPDAGPVISVGVDTRDCSVSCAPWQECVASIDGGSCIDSALALQWGLPAAGKTLASGQTTAGSVTLSKTDGGVVTITSLPVRIGAASSNFACSSGVCGGTVGNLLSPDGMKTAVAGWEDGGPTASLQLVLDSTGPVMNLVMANGTQQRDALMPVILISNEALSSASLTLDGEAVTASASTACPGYDNIAGAMACFVSDLSRPSLNALTGNFQVVYSAADSVGNASNGNAVVPVTRVRWETKPADAGVGKVEALVVGPNGDLFAGVSSNDTSGAVYRISPIDGTTLASNPLGSMQSLAAYGDVVYAAFNDATGLGSSSYGKIGGVSASSLSGLSVPCGGALDNSATYSGIALAKFGASTYAIGSINPTTLSTTPRLCKYDAINGAIFSLITGIDAAPVPTSVLTATNIIISGTSASFLNKTPGAGAFWQPVTQIDTSPVAGTHQQIGSDIGVVAQGQAVVVDSFLLGGINATARKIFLGQPDGGLADGNLAVDADTGVPAVVNSTEAYVGRGDQIVRFNPLALSTAGTPVGTVTSDFVRTSPILGKPRSVGGVAWGYAVSNGGTLVAFQQGTSVTNWHASIFSSTTVLTHPTLDCNRQRRASRTGLLYIGAADGRLRAIVVDSPGLLDTAGAWPKYQRSAGNAGNDDTTNFPTNWPGCSTF